MNWLKSRRQQIKITQEDLVTSLATHGYVYSAQTLSNWENDRHNPPLEDPQFREALAKSLKWDIADLLQAAGYEVKQSYSSMGERAARIVDHLPPDKQKMAIDILEAMAR